MAEQLVGGAAPSSRMNGSPDQVGAAVRRWRDDPVARRQVAVLALPLLVLLIGAWSHRWVTEDAFINFRIVHQTLAGHPFSFNPGERVEAGTSPLWLVVLIVAQVTLGWAIDLAWLALLLGLGLTLFGFGAGMAGAAALGRRFGCRRLLLPAGVLLLVVLPPMWDFATSGLETGLTFAWVGGSFWVLARRLGPAGDAAARLAPGAPWWVPVLLGLGPLVRPDLVLFSVTFLVALLVVSAPGGRGRARALGLALLVPVAYEVFRVAYFATLVPNTALAKEATVANWATGFRYLDNFAGTYLLAVPTVLLLVWAACLLSRSVLAPPNRSLLVVAAAPALAAAVHGLYVIRVGGDFMHGRLLLPATFGLVLPVAVLPLPAVAPRRLVAGAAGVGLVVWAVVAGASLRLPYSAATIQDGIADERAFWDTVSHTEHAITLEDHAGFSGVERGRLGRQLADQHQDVLVLRDGTFVPLSPGSGVVLEATTIGLVSEAAGTDVRVIDSLGLADAVGSRITGIEGPTRIGHEKPIDPAWVVARAAPVGTNGPVDPARVTAARRALACPRVADLLEATSAPLTPGRVIANVLAAPGLTRLRIPADPIRAAECP